MFRDSGTLHLLAVSGSNVALVILFFIWVMRPFWFGPLIRAVILLAIVAVFAGLSYGDPSVMRASIMATLVIGARLLHRSYNLNNIVAVTALIILLVEPAQLFDVGFQLSFVTAWGLVFLVPHLTDLFEQYHDRFWYRWLVFPALISFVAQLCSTPIIAYYFGRIPVISVAANLIIVPMVSIAVLGILLLLVADLVWPLLGAFVGSLLDLWLQGVVQVLAVMGGDNIPVLQTGSAFKGGVGLVAITAAYAILILTVLSFKYRLARRLVVFAVVLVTNVGLAYVVLGQTGRDRAWLDYTTVPGGVAVLIRDIASDRPDLIITGLARRSYPIDERVISPWLVRQGIQRLGRVFVLSAEYTALDDLLRSLSDYEARSLYASRHLAPSLADALTAMGDTAPRVEVTYFNGARSSQELSGYYLSDHQISVNLGPSRVDLVDKLQAGHFEADDGRISATLVIGSTWAPVADDWIQLHQSGYEQIICAKLEQRTLMPWSDSELDPDGEPPDYICDLFRTGSARFSLVF
jgi:competence protein ComEC